MSDAPAIPPSPPATRLVDFGRADIPASAKPAKVDAIFTDVAGVYDAMNDAMSLGIHRQWKNMLVRMMSPQPNQVLIDLAGGTGDIAMRYLASGGGSAIVCDANPCMVAAGRRRQAQTASLHWVVGDACCPPFPEEIAHVLTIGFGLRNITDRMAAIRAMYRLLKPGGRMYCLEFSHPHRQLVARGYRLWARLLPIMGAVIAKNAEAYRYLVESIERFPDQETLAAMLGAEGFARVRYRNLMGGVAAIHCGWKP